MKLLIVAVGQRMPDWAQSAYDDYAKRLGSEFRLELKTIKTEPRGAGGKTAHTLMRLERERIEAAISKSCPSGCRLIALDERGEAPTTLQLSQKLKTWMQIGDDVALVIGGPDGLDEGFKTAAHERMQLSKLTLPHALVRVLLIEQIYRAWSVLHNHPYHRE